MISFHCNSSDISIGHNNRVSAGLAIKETEIFSKCFSPLRLFREKLKHTHNWCPTPVSSSTLWNKHVSVACPRARRLSFSHPLGVPCCWKQLLYVFPIKLGASLFLKNQSALLGRSALVKNIYRFPRASVLTGARDIPAANFTPRRQTVNFLSLLLLLLLLDRYRTWAGV